MVTMEIFEVMYENYNVLNFPYRQIHIEIYAV